VPAGNLGLSGRRARQYRMFGQPEGPRACQYKYTGPYAGKRVTERSLGDPHEHGTVRTYIERE
jgi:hypothetical protein